MQFSYANVAKMIGSKTVLLLVLLQHLVLTFAFAVSGHDRSSSHHLHHSLSTDKAALLAFKKTIVSDPNSALGNWIDSVDVCNFTGIQCDYHHHRVKKLNLTSMQLTGLLSPVISNLTGLRVFILANNNFYGVIPPELSDLRHLNRLRLETNNLHGPFPDTFSYLKNLTLVALKDNNLSGRIPTSFFFNCTRLRLLDLSYNFLSGSIPEEIGNCPDLWTLSLYNNQLTGEIPASLTNVSLYNIDVEYNYLSAELPVSIVAKQPSLVYLHLSYNNMISHDNNTNLLPFFDALINCTILEELELAGMNLGGQLPGSIGQVSPRLYSLLLQENHISGMIPSNIKSLSALGVLNLTYNSLNGTIPVEISRLRNLEQLFLSHNLFTGDIPAALGRLSRLGLLDLSNNQLSGVIPSSLGNLVRISYMFLDNNLLSGAIPPTLGRCSDLYKLDLSYNRLTGSIPPDILGMREIRIFLNLSHNYLNGTLPLELSKLEKVQEIDVSSNNLSGTIFPQISKCIELRMIDFSHNSLQGHLPDSLADLRNLEFLDASENNLSGMIPESLSKIQTLKFLNLSSNNLEGPIPIGGIFSLITVTSFLGNGRLCGGRIPGVPCCSQKKSWFQSSEFLIILVVVIFVTAFVATICCVTGIVRVKAMLSFASLVKGGETETKSATELIHNFPRISYRELSEATSGFSEQRLIGAGSYGRVYKGVLPNGTTIAVKVLLWQSRNSTKSFNKECQVLKSIRHRNLIRIITACSIPDFKALVLPFMVNGSLDGHLYSSSCDLTLIQRVNICSDVAEGMAYLHHYSPVKVIHCDLKPTNVLLNENMTGLVSDFGIARLVMTVGGGGNGGTVENMGNSTANMLSGSIGYIAPEYGFGANMSTKGDVYSFGILVLEMVTRKRPTDNMFDEGLSLQKWVKKLYHRSLEKVIDPSLVMSSRDQSPEVKRMWEVAVRELIELGILCTQESPSARPTMLNVADDLDRLKRYLNGDTTANFASSLGVSSFTADDD